MQKNLKIFNVFLFSKADDDKALFCSFSFLPYLGGGKLGSVPGSGGFPGKRWPEMLNRTIINPPCM